MPRYSTNELNAYVAGSSTVDFLLGVASGVRDFACGLYRDYQDWTLVQSLPGTPVSDFLRGSWDAACSYPGAPGLPPPSLPPFAGGQCPILYRVGVFAADGGGAIYRLPGPIGGWATPPGNPEGLFVKVGNPLPESQPLQNYGGLWFFALTNTGRPAPGSLFIHSVVNGEPDDCGDPPTPLNPTPPPPERLRDNLPIPRAPDRPGSPWNIPIVYAPISPTANFNVDVGGVNFNFDLGGISFDLGEDKCATEFDQEELLQRLADLQDQSDLLRDSLDDLRRRSPLNPDSPFDIGSDYEFSPEAPPTAPPDVEGIERLAFVQVRLTQAPTNAKTQWGGGGPDLRYAGWFEFKVGNLCLPREPIHFDRSIFKAPAGADGFAYTTYVGFEAAHTIIRYKEEE